MIFFKNKILSFIPVISLIAVIVLMAGCSGEPKYTYEEYKKLKALNQSNESGLPDDSLAENSGEIDGSLQSYYDDLNQYNFYIKDFTTIYDKYFDLLIPLFDSFDSEREDLDKKNEYAESIQQNFKDWIAELDDMDVPETMSDYHNYILEYLNKEILFYNSFLLGDAELADSYQIEANNAYENSTKELQDIEQGLRERAQKLGVEEPF